MDTVWGMMLLAALGGVQADPADTLPVHDGEASTVLQQVVGNTLIGIDTQLQAFRARYQADGSVRREQGGRIDQGQWWIDDQGLVCQRWRRFDHGDTNCYRWGTGDERIVYYDRAGRLRAHARLAQGNPYGL